MKYKVRLKDSDKEFTLEKDQLTKLQSELRCRRRPKKESPTPSGKKEHARVSVGSVGALATPSPKPASPKKAEEGVKRKLEKSLATPEPAKAGKAVKTRKVQGTVSQIPDPITNVSNWLSTTKSSTSSPSSSTLPSPNPHSTATTLSSGAIAVKRNTSSRRAKAINDVIRKNFQTPKSPEKPKPETSAPPPPKEPAPVVAAPKAVKEKEKENAKPTAGIFAVPQDNLAKPPKTTTPVLSSTGGRRRKHARSESKGKGASKTFSSNPKESPTFDKGKAAKQELLPIYFPPQMLTFLEADEYRVYNLREIPKMGQDNLNYSVHFVLSKFVASEYDVLSDEGSKAIQHAKDFEMLFNKTLPDQLMYRLEFGRLKELYLDYHKEGKHGDYDIPWSLEVSAQYLVRFCWIIAQMTDEEYVRNKDHSDNNVVIAFMKKLLRFIVTNKAKFLGAHNYDAVSPEYFRMMC